MSFGVRCGRSAAPRTKGHAGRLPRRRVAVIPKGPKRSGGAAQPLDGGSAAWLLDALGSATAKWAITLAEVGDAYEMA
jgi:hypothetical protein